MGREGQVVTEPVGDCLVVDEWGDVWTRGVNGWSCARRREIDREWDAVAAHGIRRIYRPEAEPVRPTGDEAIVVTRSRDVDGRPYLVVGVEDVLIPATVGDVELSILRDGLYSLRVDLLTSWPPRFLDMGVGR